MLYENARLAEFILNLVTQVITVRSRAERNRCAIWKWAAKHGLHVPKERYLEGEFFSMRTGRWCPADWWLEYFEVSHVTDLIRMDCLESDLNDLLQSVDPSLPRIALPHLNELGVTEPMTLRPEAYEVNPQWTALEARLWPNRAPH